MDGTNYAAGARRSALTRHRGDAVVAMITIVPLMAAAGTSTNLRARGHRRWRPKLCIFVGWESRSNSRFKNTPRPRWRGSSAREFRADKRLEPATTMVAALDPTRAADSSSAPLENLPRRAIMASEPSRERRGPFARRSRLPGTPFVAPSSTAGSVSFPRSFPDPFRVRFRPRAPKGAMGGSAP